MAINKKLIHFKNKQKFNEELANGNILETSIVFIQETTEIYTHGQFYDGSTFDPSNIEKSIENIINNKADKTELPTKTSDLTNDSGFITINDVPALEIPEEYVTETELNDKGFLTEHQDISSKQDKLHSYIEQKENDQVISAIIGINNENDTLAIGLDSNTKEAVMGVSDSTNLSIIKTTSTSIVVESGLAGANNPGLHVDTQSARIQSENGTAVVSVNNSGVMSINADELSVNIPIVNISDNIFVSTQTENSASILSMMNNGEVSLSTINNGELSEINLGAGYSSINAANQMNINTNELVLPELSKVKFGEQTLSTSGAYSLVNHEISDTTFILTPNTFHVWGEVTTLDLDLGIETEGIANEYLFQFTSGSTATSLSLPDSIKWTNEPNIGTNKIYQISILNGLGSILEFSV